MKLSCFRYLGVNDFKQIDRMTISEFNFRMQAYRLQQVDRMNDIHMQAWANNMAGQKKKNGRPVYRKFDQFFNYKKAVKQAKKQYIPTTTEKLKSFIADFNSKKGG